MFAPECGGIVKLFDVKHQNSNWEILEDEGPVLATDFECIRDRWYYNLHKIRRETNTVKGIIGNTRVNPLIDTGASISVIDRNLFSKVFAGQGLVQEFDTDCELADGSSIKTRGIWATKVVLGVVAYPIELYIWPRVSRGMIIGREFLRNHGVVISYKTRKTGKAYGVEAVEDMLIPPRRRAEVVGMIERPLWEQIPEGMEAWFEQDPQEGMEGIAVARTLVNVHSDRIPIQIVNYTRHSIRVPKGTKLGALVPGPVSERVEVNGVDDEETDENFSPSVDIEDTTLGEQQREEVQKLCNRYRDVFVGPSGKLGLTQLLKHRIELKEGAKPIHKMPHRQSPMMREAMNDILQEQMGQGIIERCQGSPWASPAFLVAKGSATVGGKKRWRMVVDYRGLNAATIDRVLNIPRADDIFDNVGQTCPKFFSCLDLQAGFHQMPIDKADRDKTAFITHSGTYSYATLPMGMTNSPRSFQLLMDLVLTGASYKYALAFLDDVIIFSPSYKDHLAHLEDVFQRLREARLKLRASKCVLFRNKIKYLGHSLSAEGISPHEDNIKPIRALQTPGNVSAVQSFLGMVGYYRKFIRNFACRAKPLTNLTREGVPFQWGINEQESFDDLRSAILGRDILSYPDFTKPFELTTDACNYGMGAVLAQRNEQGQAKPVAFAAKTFSHAEENYPITEKELCAVVWACNHFRVYLESRRFQLFTDHKALNWMLTTSKLNPKMARWVTTLQGFKFDISHVKGKNNVVADALSRLPAHSQICNRPLDVIIEERAEYVQQKRKRRDDKEVHSIEGIERPKGAERLSIGQIDRADIIKEQMRDKFCLPLIAYLRDGILPQCDKEARRTLLAEINYILEEDVLYRLDTAKRVKHGARALLVMPRSLVKGLLRMHHEESFGSHMGASKMTNTMRMSFFWVGMARDIIQYCKSCHICNETKRMTHPIRAPLTLREPSPRPWAIANLDAMEDLPLTSAGNKHIINVVDFYSRYLISFPVPDLTANTLIEHFYPLVVCRVGGIGRLVMDNGSAFISKTFEVFCAKFGIAQSFITALNPKASGLVERTNRSVLGILRTLVNDRQDDWDKYLPSVAAGINMTPVYATGHSPHLLLHGVEPIRPMTQTVGDPWDSVGTVSDRFTEILERLQQAEQASRQALIHTQEVMKDRYDQRAFMPDITPGDIVYLYWPRISKPGQKLKLGKIYHGPMVVLRYNTEKTVFLKRLTDGKVMTKPVTIDRLKKALLPHNVNEWNPVPNVQPPPIELEEDDFPLDSFLGIAEEERTCPPGGQLSAAPPIENDQELGNGSAGEHGELGREKVPTEQRQGKGLPQGPAASKNLNTKNPAFHAIKGIVDVVKPRGEEAKYKVVFRDGDVLWLPKEYLNHEAVAILVDEGRDPPREMPRLRSMRR